MLCWKTGTSTSNGSRKKRIDPVTIQSREEVIARLTISMERIARVRRAAQLEAIIRAGDEPAPVPPIGELGPPSPEFSGQPPRSGPTTG